MERTTQLRNIPLFLLLGFFALDIAAPWLGMEQVSVWVWAHPWQFRLLCALALIVLAAHLMFPFTIRNQQW